VAETKNCCGVPMIRYIQVDKDGKETVGYICRYGYYCKKKIKERRQRRGRRAA
jgi:hypothetical protein